LEAEPDKPTSEGWGGGEKERTGTTQAYVLVQGKHLRGDSKKRSSDIKKSLASGSNSKGMSPNGTGSSDIQDYDAKMLASSPHL